MKILKNDYDKLNYIFKMKYVKFDKEQTIVSDKLPFRITTAKCQSYIDIHYPNLQINDIILNRCQNILIYLLRYMDDYCEGDNLIICGECEFWSRSFLPSSKFELLFYTKKFTVLCDDPYNESWLKLYSLPNLLINDEYYNIFIDYWSDRSNRYDYYDIYNVMKKVTNKYSSPEDLIDTIICLGF